MSWYKHPKFSTARKLFIESFSSSQLQSLHNHLPKIVFICGGDAQYHPNRQILETYFEVHLKKFLTFRAEDAWSVISKHSNAENSLAHEEWLAGFSDIVIILVESFGTVAELGAFSLSPQLRRKLLPILNVEYQNANSFINTGPVKWINSDSKFKPCIYTNFETILTAIPEIEKRIDINFHDTSTERFGKYKFTNKVMLFFTLQILVALGPISPEEVSNITFDLLGQRNKRFIDSILAIGIALGIFQLHQDESNNDYYYCKDFERLFSSNNTKILLHRIQLNRAKSLSHLLKIEQYNSMIEEIHGNFA